MREPLDAPRGDGAYDAANLGEYAEDIGYADEEWTDEGPHREEALK